MKIKIQDKKGTEKLVQILQREVPEVTRDAIELVLYEWDLMELNNLTEEQTEKLLVEAQTKNKNYFVFSEPYYSLICAKNIETAKAIYNENVCNVDEDTEFKEVSLEQAKKEVENSDVCWFEVFGNELMLVDTALL